MKSSRHLNYTFSYTPLSLVFNPFRKSDPTSRLWRLPLSLSYNLSFSEFDVLFYRTGLDTRQEFRFNGWPLEVQYRVMGRHESVTYRRRTSFQPASLLHPRQFFPVSTPVNTKDVVLLDSSSGSSLYKEMDNQWTFIPGKKKRVRYRIFNVWLTLPVRPFYSKKKKKR